MSRRGPQSRTVSRRSRIAAPTVSVVLARKKDGKQNREGSIGRVGGDGAGRLFRANAHFARAPAVWVVLGLKRSTTSLMPHYLKPVDPPFP